MAHVLTTKELSRYLKLHEITICKRAAEGKIPAIRIGKVWRFDKDAIDSWIREERIKMKAQQKSKRKGWQKGIREGKAKLAKNPDVSG